MEERKKMGPLGVVGLILLALLLALGCYLSAGVDDLTMGHGPWGVYTTDSGSVYLSSAYLETDTRDVLITRRDSAPADGMLVTYLLDGIRYVDLYDDLLGRPVMAEEATVSPEPVIGILRDGGAVIHALHAVRFWLWGLTGGLLVLMIALKLTSNARWRRRQQKLMRQNFQTYGEKYQQEDQDMDY